MPRRLPAILLAAFLAMIAAVGCEPDSMDGASAEASEAGTRLTEESEPTSPVGTLSGRTPGGTLVRVAFSPDPPAAGIVHLAAELEPGPEAREAVSVDLVSPEMPSHGVIRYDDVRWETPNRFTLDVPIPMGGLWELYVNLDVGLDAIAFEVRVPSAPNAAHDHAPADAQAHHHP